MDLDKAADPVCGRLVDIATPHRAELIGKTLFFCSDACLDRFVADPAAFDDEGTILLSRADLRSDVSAVRVVPGQSALPDRDPGGPGVPVAAAESSPARRPPSIPAAAAGFRFVRAVPGATPPPAGPFGWLGRLITQWQERRQVVSTCTQMLARFDTIAKAYPGGARKDLYRQLIMDRVGCDAAAAGRAVDQAADSFTQWPRPRPLTLRDVVHFMAVVEYLADHPAAAGMLSDVDGLVAERIPEGL